MTKPNGINWKFCSTGVLSRTFSYCASSMLNRYQGTFFFKKSSIRISIDLYPQGYDEDYFYSGQSGLLFLKKTFVALDAAVVFQIFIQCIVVVMAIVASN